MLIADIIDLAFLKLSVVVFIYCKKINFTIASCINDCCNFLTISKDCHFLLNSILVSSLIYAKHLNLVAVATVSIVSWGWLRFFSWLRFYDWLRFFGNWISSSMTGIIWITFFILCYRLRVVSRCGMSCLCCCWFRILNLFFNLNLWFFCIHHICSSCSSYATCYATKYSCSCSCCNSLGRTTFFLFLHVCSIIYSFLLCCFRVLRLRLLFCCSSVLRLYDDCFFVIHSCLV